jgi:hypothetical protein
MVRWPFTARSSDGAERDLAGDLLQVRPDDPRPRVLIGLLAADPEDISRALRLIERYRRVRAVVAVTGGDAEAFGRLGAVVEHLPDPRDVSTHRVQGHWAAYLRRRWDLILAKWRPVSVLHEGLVFEDYLSACALPVAGSPGNGRDKRW